MEPEKLLEKMRLALGDEGPTALSRLRASEECDPFRILIGTILSQRTRDEKTSEVTERLFKKFKGAEDLAQADPGEVSRLIRGVGFYNMKSRRIIEAAKMVVQEYGGRVPDSMEELLKIPSVGRKTANCVLVYGFGIDAIPVDTHVHRVSNRIGIVDARTPEETERQLQAFFPREYWLVVNDLFIRFGKAVCKPIGPRHDLCTLRDDCKYYKIMAKPVKK